MQRRIQITSNISYYFIRVHYCVRSLGRSFKPLYILDTLYNLYFLETYIFIYFHASHFQIYLIKSFSRKDSVHVKFYFDGSKMILQPSPLNNIRKACEVIEKKNRINFYGR